MNLRSAIYCLIWTFSNCPPFQKLFNPRYNNVDERYLLIRLQIISQNIQDCADVTKTNFKFEDVYSAFITANPNTRFNGMDDVISILLRQIHNSLYFKKKLSIHRVGTGLGFDEKQISVINAISDKIVEKINVSKIDQIFRKVELLMDIQQKIPYGFEAGYVSPLNCNHNEDKISTLDLFNAKYQFRYRKITIKNFSDPRNIMFLKPEIMIFKLINKKGKIELTEKVRIHKTYHLCAVICLDPITKRWYSAFLREDTWYKTKKNIVKCDLNDSDLETDVVYLFYSLRPIYTKGDYETCSICLEDFEEGEQVYKRECMHLLHPTCQLLYMKKKCPVCKSY